MKKRYTVVYAKTWLSGSHMYSLTKFERIETTNLGEAIKCFECNIWFVFDGWPEITKDLDHENLHTMQSQA